MAEPYTPVIPALWSQRFQDTLRNLERVNTKYGAESWSRGKLLLQRITNRWQC